MFRHTAIALRDALLDRLLSARGILNAGTLPAHSVDASDSSALPQQVAAALKAFKAAAVADDGSTVNYAVLRQHDAYASYRALSAALRTFDPDTLTTRQQKLAFWINLYNGLVLDGVMALGVRRSVTEQVAGLAFFRRAAYGVGGQRVNCDDIEHGILRANRGHPFVPGPQFGPRDPRLGWVIMPPDPRIHFALNCASRSCPPIGFYDADRLDEQLDLATRHFVNAETALDSTNGAQPTLQLSRIFKWYAADFGGGPGKYGKHGKYDGVLAFLLRYLPNDERHAWIAQSRVIKITFRPYDWALNTAP